MMPEVPKPLILKGYNVFVDSEIPENSIEFDKNGRLLSNKQDFLRFIQQILLNEFEYLPEKNNNTKYSDEEKSKKNKSKKLKKHKKRIKNMKEFRSKNAPSDSGNNLDYHRKFSSTDDFNNSPYYKQPFSASTSSSSQTIPNNSNADSSMS